MEFLHHSGSRYPVHPSQLGTCLMKWRWFLFNWSLVVGLSYLMFDDADTHGWKLFLLYVIGNFLGWLEGRRYVG